MVTQPKNAYKHIILYYIILYYIILYYKHSMAPHVVTTLVAILREVHYKGYITEVLEPMHKCKTLSFKMILKLSSVSYFCALV
jgi:hypothetical protein